MAVALPQNFICANAMNSAEWSCH